MATPSSAELIRSSFEIIAPQADRLMDRFYERLFAAAPQVRPLFPKDMVVQKKHLAAAVGLVVKHADNLEALAGPLADMGRRHVKYGARPEHYNVVRDQMIGAIRDVAGAACTPPVERAWTDALDAVAAAMLKGVAADAA